MGSAFMVPAGSPPQEAVPAARHRKALVDHKVLSVVLGNVLFKTWYPSFYPEELIGKDVDRLYICQWCFKYSKELIPFAAHMLFTQNLSLFAKLFLDNKSVFYDVSTFNYYVLVRTLPSTPSRPPLSQIVGFFSKEKMSWDNNNLACILIFPPWQRKGLGKILMGVSYELSKRAACIGGPEKPLSELGRKGYIRFWEAAIARTMLETKAKTNMSISDIAAACWILPEDVLVALKEMDVMETKKRVDGSTVIKKAKVREWVRSSKADLTPPVFEKDVVLDWPSEDAMDERG